jgi:hypothetical protein
MVPNIALVKQLKTRTMPQTIIFGRLPDERLMLSTQPSKYPTGLEIGDRSQKAQIAALLFLNAEGYTGVRSQE